MPYLGSSQEEEKMHSIHFIGKEATFTEDTGCNSICDLEGEDEINFVGRESTIVYMYGRLNKKDH